MSDTFVRNARTGKMHYRPVQGKLACGYPLPLHAEHYVRVYGIHEWCERCWQTWQTDLEANKP